MVSDRESDVEGYLVRCVERIGGKCLKWVCPSVRGAPDRIVFYNGKIWFVELKTAGGHLSSHQELFAEMMEPLGVTVHYLWHRGAVDEFVNSVIEA